MTPGKIITLNAAERLFYEIAASLDDFALTVATLKIPSVATEGSHEYDELIKASAARRIEIGQVKKQQRN